MKAVILMRTLIAAIIVASVVAVGAVAHTLMERSGFAEQCTEMGGYPIYTGKFQVCLSPDVTLEVEE